MKSQLRTQWALGQGGRFKIGQEVGDLGLGGSLEIWDWAGVEAG